MDIFSSQDASGGNTDLVEKLRGSEIGFGPLAEGIGGRDGVADLKSVGGVGGAEDVVTTPGAGGPDKEGGRRGNLDGKGRVHADEADAAGFGAVLFAVAGGNDGVERMQAEVEGRGRDGGSGGGFVCGRAERNHRAEQFGFAYWF